VLQSEHNAHRNIGVSGNAHRNTAVSSNALNFCSHEKVSKSTARTNSTSSSAVNDVFDQGRAEHPRFSESIYT